MTWASTGIEGLEDFSVGSYSLVLVDWKMLEMDGRTMIDHIGLQSHVPIAMIRSKNEESDKVEGLNDGKTITSYTLSTNTTIISDIASNGEHFVQLTLKEPALRLIRSNSLTIGEDETIEVRQLQGTKIDSEYFKFLQWDEQGLRYNVIFKNPDLTFEQVLAITEQMEFTK